MNATCSAHIPSADGLPWDDFCDRPGELADDIGPGFGLCAEHRPAHRHRVETRRGTTRIYAVPFLRPGTQPEPDAVSHAFRTLFGLPPEKGDLPACGAQITDAYDFARPGDRDRPTCPDCELLIAEAQA